MRWRATWAACLLQVTLIACAWTTGHAEEPAPVALQTGQAAPYDGILLSRVQAEEAAKQLTFLRVLLEDVKRERTLREETHQLQLANLKADWEAERKATKEKNDLDVAEYRKRLERAENPPWYRQNETHRLIGLIIGIAVGIAAGGI